VILGLSLDIKILEFMPYFGPLYGPSSWPL
jgi:hypothetical protein